MAISDEIMVIGIVTAFTYASIYKKSWFFGNMIFILLGTTLIYFGVGNTTITIAGVAWVLISIVNLIADWVKDKF